MKSQTIQIDSTFTTDAEIFPFEPGDTIYGLSISGTVQLFSDTSLVRVILSDLNGNEWMVYEAYPMIYPNKNCNLINFADETKYLFVTHPTKLYISLIEATLFLDSIHPDYNPHEDLSMLQNQHKDIIETNKEDSITFSIANHSMLWFANRNGMSDKSYQEKKILFGEKYNLMGLDYYGGGLFDGIPGVTGSKDESELVEEFDWRNRHGANNPVKTNFYYDGDPTGSGWLTSIKDQSPYECNGTCYIHGPLGAIEGVSNLYYNQHIDYELSVQHILDCDDEFYWPNWPDCKGNPGGTHQFIREIGVMDDDAYNRDPIELECRSDQPPDGQPDYWIKIHDFHGLINFTTEVLKESLIHFGPMEVVIHNFQFGPHSMALVGYGTLKIGYTFHNPLNTTEIRTVVADSEYEGHLFWKLKNSWGPGWGDLGYFYYLAEETEITQPIYYELPIINILPGQDEMLAFDKDKDGYWNWGISESHDLPEGVCSELKDSDDSENRIGPFDQFYYGTPILPDMKVYLLSNVLPEYIDHQSFLSFSSNDLIQGKLQFFIENPGNAQLNLRPWGFVGERPVEIIEVDGSSPNYSISDTDQPQIKVCMGTANGFHITFTGTQQGELTKVRIYLDENDEIPDFEFILVYNDCQTSNVIQELTGNNYWSSFALKPDNYLITNGATLNITGEIALGINSNIYIAPGGELILDGGRLTSSCGSLWKGIDVWGDRTKPQFEGAQGIVRVRNGGIIENAWCGIENLCWHNGVPMYTGGIFDIIDAEFKDNQIAIRFWPYYNINPVTRQEVDNFSRIRNSEFRTTQNLYDLGFTPQCFISMTEVKGVKIVASTFKNETFTVENAGIGIYATAADFTVDHYCPVYQIPCPEYTPCHFENLEYGIHASAITSIELAWIRNSEFVNNKSGIYLSAYSYPAITRNIFEVRKAQHVPIYDAVYCGLYLDNCTQYDVEENNFYTFLDDEEKEDLVSTGLIVNNSGEDNNIIYNNTFDGLYAGLIAQEVNRNAIGDKGLQIKCNTFINDVFDVAVTHSTLGVNGIAKDQGSDYDDASAPASNRFTLIESGQNSEPDGNFYNICENITYWHHQNTTGYNLVPSRHSDSPAVEPLPGEYFESFDEEQCCPSRLGGSALGIEDEKGKMLSAGQNMDSINNILNLLVDGGDTEVLLSEIQISWPEDGYELYSTLISESPYLSDTSIIKAVEKEDVLLPGMITDVLAANPQSAKSDKIMNTVDERINPFSDDQLADIGQGRFITGAKESLESRQAEYLFTKDLSKSNIIRSYKADTLCESPTDSIINILNYQPELSDEYRKAFEYFAKRDSSNVINTLDEIPLNHDLNDARENEHSLYEDYFDVLSNPDISGSLILNLDSAQKTALHYIVDNSTGILKAQARNILILTDSLDYSEPIILPQPGLKSEKVRFWPEKSLESENSMKIYPNPAKNVVVIETKLIEEPQDAFINLIDTKGIIVKTYPIFKQNNYLVVPTDDLQQGIVICRLIIQNQLIKSRKLVILK